MVVNPRFPVAEMEKVGALFPSPENFFTNPETEANKLVEMKALALQQRRSNLTKLNQGISDDATRQAVLANNFEIDRLLGMLSTVPNQITGNVDSNTVDSFRSFIQNQKAGSGN